MKNAALIIGGAAFFCILAILVAMGLGIGTLVFTPLFLLLLPYWLLGRKVIQGASMGANIGFAVTAILMISAFLFIFRT
ncbi:MAG: hypothetical protein ACR2IV_19110 [Bryobacteraceae bacterium]